MRMGRCASMRKAHGTIWIRRFDDADHSSTVRVGSSHDEREVENRQWVRSKLSAPQNHGRCRSALLPAITLQCWAVVLRFGVAKAEIANKSPFRRDL